MTTTTVAWTGTVTALSAVVHGGDQHGSITLLRREMVIGADGRPIMVPLITGNALRGRLRRIGEELTRDVLGYEGQLPLAAAHALRGGGALAKTTGEPLSGARLARIRALVPQIAVFGAAAGGRILSGQLLVGRLIPHLAETTHLTGQPGPTMFEAIQLESYSRVDELANATFHTLTTDDSQNTERGPMVWRVETFPAGTRFASWIRLEHASDLQVAFTADVLAEFSRAGYLGGRSSIGHGQVRADWTRTEHPQPAAAADWRAHLHHHRAEALEAIRMLT